MCNSQASEIKLRKRFINLDSKVSISILNFQEFLVTAFGLHDGVISRGVNTVFVQTENEFISTFEDLQITINLNAICIQHVSDPFKLSKHSLHYHALRNEKQENEGDKYVLWSEATNCLKFVVFKVLMAVGMKFSIFWDIMLCSPLMLWRNISPPTSGFKNKQSKIPTCHMLHAGFLFGLFFNHERGGEMFQ